MNYCSIFRYLATITEVRIIKFCHTSALGESGWNKSATQIIAKQYLNSDIKGIGGTKIIFQLCVTLTGPNRIVPPDTELHRYTFAKFKLWMLKHLDFAQSSRDPTLNVLLYILF